MLETKEQKQYLAATIVLIVILSVISLWHRPDLSVTVSTNTNAKPAFDYNAYLAAIKADPVASQKIFQQIITQDQIKQEVEQTLQTDQKIIPPVLDQNKITIDPASNKDTITSYLQNVGQNSAAFSSSTRAAAQNLFYPDQDQSQLQQSITDNTALINSLYSLKAPGETKNFHQALLTVYTAYLDAQNLALAYEQNPQADPWPKFYNDFQVINNNAATLNAELGKLDNKYQISQLPINPRAAVSKSQGLFFSVPTAHAQFGSATLIIGDIPQNILQALEQGLASSFANFATQFLNNLITAIEKNYKIANFLYYTDALVSGQYVGDYLNKYVADSVDRAMITNFIPQFNCGQPQDIKQVLQAKADQYLGFDPQNVSPSDPQYYQKMANIGNFLSSPNGWQLYYQDMAASAQSAAEQAADQELTSNGLKSPRDAIGTEIAASLSSINDSMQAIFDAQLNLGVINADQVISQLVSQVTYNLFNKFVFRGAVVYKEQSACLPTPQLTPVIPAQTSPYQPPAPVDTQQIQDQECANFPRGCPTQYPLPTIP